MKKILLFILLAFVPVLGQAKIDTLKISSLYTTHIIFSTDLTYADLSNNRVVAGKIIEQNKNMLALKAREPFTGSCSVSALESNGTMHTFIVVYREHPDELVIDARPKEKPMTYVSPTARLIAEQREKEASRSRQEGRGSAPSRSATGGNVSMWKSGKAPLLQDVVKQPQHLFHIGCKEYDIQALCEDISSYNDITYLIISLRNDSGISYEIGDATFVIESKNKGGKRTVKYDTTVFPRNRQGKLTAAPGEYTRAAYSFDKLTLSKDQVLKVYLYEEGGQRNLVMTISAKDINKARSQLS